jgi:glucokinase
VEPDGRPCLCGLRGCLEAYSSGPSIVRVAVERGFAGEPTGQTVIAAARAGEASAVFAVEQAARMLGRGLATLCMLLNPQRIVLGTLAVHAGDLLLPTVRETLRESAWSRLVDDVEIVPAALGDRAQDLAALCAFLHRRSELEQEIERRARVMEALTAETEKLGL